MLSFESGYPIAYVIPAQHYNSSRRVPPKQEEEKIEEELEERDKKFGGKILNQKQKKKKKKKRKKKIKILRTIYVKTDVEEDDPPDIVTANKGDLIDKDDIQYLKEKFKLNNYS